MTNPTDEKILEEFKKKFNYGVFYSGSSDLSAGEGIDWRYPKMTPDEVMDFILSALQTVREEERNRLGKEIVEALEKEINHTEELQKTARVKGEYDLIKYGIILCKKLISSLTFSPSIKDDCFDCWDRWNKVEGCPKHRDKK